MNNEQLSMIIPFLSLLVSAASSIIVAVISARLRIKEKKLDINERIAFQNIDYYEKHKTEVIENFLKSAGQCILKKNDNNLKEFGASIPEIYLYVDESYWKEIDNLIKCINAGKHSEAITVLMDFAKSISKIKPQRQRIELNSKLKLKDKLRNLKSKI